MSPATFASIMLVITAFVASAQSQSCPIGQSTPGTCMQVCNKTSCNMVCSDIDGTCIQNCLDSGSCPSVDCSSSKMCIQMCLKDCDSLVCKSDNCTQSCEGSCQAMTCDSRRCFQMCQKGGCKMECSGNAEYCSQVCTKDCTFKCNAKQCQSVCEDGGCKYEGAPRNKTACDSVEDGTCLQIGCPYKGCHMDCSKSAVPQKECAQTCYPPVVPCPKQMTCDTSSCSQTCYGDCELATCGPSTECVQQCGGKCKSARCTSKVCSQFCLNGACALECADRTELCSQACNGTSCRSLVSSAKTAEVQLCHGNCQNMMCKSANCTQTCKGKCPKMTCNGESCTQECSGESCAMHCPKSVKSCAQTCKRGTCKLLCEAENCKKNCADSAECTKYDPKSSGTLFRLDLTLLVNGMFLVILGVLF